MAKFNFSNFKESLNGLTNVLKTSRSSVQILLAIAKENALLRFRPKFNGRIAKYGFIGLLTFFVVCVIVGGSLFATMLAVF